jgi:hypothetical protein
MGQWKRCPQPGCSGHLELVTDTGAIECSECDYCERGGVVRLPTATWGAAPADKAVSVALELRNPGRAWALARLCKRLQFPHCRQLAASDAEASEMLHATHELAQALAAAGFDLR